MLCAYTRPMQISGERLQDHWSSGLAHLSRRLIGELIVYPWVRRPSVVVRRPSSVHNAQTSSSHKPLGRLKPNFMWSLLG